jgi:predicted MFS family arabinose efflux permease
LLLVVGFLVLFTSAGARFAIGLTLKPMAEEFVSGRGEIGLAVALCMIVSATFGLVAGRLADRMNLQLLLAGGLVVSAVGLGLMSLITAPWHALLLYGLVFGVGNGLTSIPPISVLVTRAFPERTGLANSVVTSGMSFGQLVMIALLAAILVSIGWRSVFFWLGMAQLLVIPLLFVGIPRDKATASQNARQRGAGLTMRDAARTRQFWLLVVIYAICGFDDFFVGTHVVAFAQDRGVDTFVAGNLLALMGLTALIGVIAAGVWADRSGPVWATAASFGARVCVFALVTFDQSPLSVAIFALVFGSTFLVTAPLTVLFVRESFGTAHLGALNGLITMVHQICGGLGAYVGAEVFDVTGKYDIAFMLMFVVSALALGLTLALRRSPTYGPDLAGTS